MTADPSVRRGRRELSARPDRNAVQRAFDLIGALFFGAPLDARTSSPGPRRHRVSAGPTLHRGVHPHGDGHKA